MKNPYEQCAEDIEQSQVEFHNLNKANNDRKYIRLLAVHNEAEYFLKTLNLIALKWLAWIQGGASITIFVLQVMLYGIAKYRFYKIVDTIAIGIWAPLLFFINASCLTWMITKHPSGCSIGTAIAFQIMSIFFGVMLIFLSAVSLSQHGYRASSVMSEIPFNAEALSQVLMIFMIIAGLLICVSSLFVSSHLCRTICCNKVRRTTKSTLFDVVTPK